MSRLPRENEFHPAGMLVGPVVIAALIVAMGGWSGDGMPHVGIDAIVTLFGALPLALAWLVPAAGLGWPLRLSLAPDSHEPAAMQIALGVAAMLTLDSALGRLGMLQLGGSAGTWGLIIVGCALLSWQIGRGGMRREANLSAPNWLFWTAAPSIAVLLIASASAPGWLWDTEYGGYDALSYHLQLPREWMALGAITPLEHNVYSFFPGAMEAAYYHLMVMRGGAIAAVYSCQLLHAMIGVIAAWLVGRLASRIGGTLISSHGGPVAAIALVVLVGTPWVIVAGSLAYNEMPMLLMLAAGLLAIAEQKLDSTRRAALVGLFAGAACAAKLTAIGFVAAPLGVLLLMTLPVREWLKALAPGLIAGTLALAPYVIHNSIAAGNPVFPFATGIFGTAHWDAEQAATWRDAHRSDLAIGARLTEVWNQLFRFGIGEPPPNEERWHPQWSVLPWLVVAAVVMLLARPSTRGWGGRLVLVIAIQCAFWVTFTHIKSRFMLPAVVPGAVAIALACGFLRSSQGSSKRYLTIAMGIALLLWSSVSTYVFARQANGDPAQRIGMAGIMIGETLTPVLRERVGRSDSPAIYLNHLLPKRSRILFVGEAAPLYFLGDFTYNTVWDRGPFSKLTREYPDNPHAWLGALRDQGYTHIFVDPVMLARWEKAGWNDPLITLDRVMMAMQAGARPEHRWPRGEMLFTIE